MNPTPFFSNNTIEYDGYGSESFRWRRPNGIEDSIDPISDEEKIMIEHLSHAKSLISVRELASSIQLSTPEKLSLEDRSSIRRKKTKDNNIVICSNTIRTRSLEDMGLPESILNRIKSDSIDPLTPIQIQALSIAMSGKDMLGLSFTGSGTSLMSALPLVMVGLQEEVCMPISHGEGPFGLILCASTELATHTFQFVQALITTLKNPELKPVLCVDGKDVRFEFEMLERGVHVIVATPGRLNYLLANKKMNLDSCRYLALDKAELLFERRSQDDIQSILGCLKDRRQTLLFCGNVTAEVQNFAENGMMEPVTVNAAVSDLTKNVNAVTIGYV